MTMKEKTPSDGWRLNQDDIDARNEARGECVTADPNYVMPIEEKLKVACDTLDAYREMYQILSNKADYDREVAYAAIRDLVGVGVYYSDANIPTLKGLNREAYIRAVRKHAEVINKAIPPTSEGV